MARLDKWQEPRRIPTFITGSSVDEERSDPLVELLHERQALGGGVDGFASFSFNVSFTVVTRQIGHLEVGDEDVSGGEGFPPVRNAIPLVLNP